MFYHRVILPNDTNRAVQLKKMAKSLKFRIKEVEGLYYPRSENKDVDQLRGYHEADLRLWFRICKKPHPLFKSIIWVQASYPNSAILRVKCKCI